MSNKLYFMNSGHFDVRAMMTFGVSAKEQENAIGFFGTGFKYAVAIILRLGGSIWIDTKNEDGKSQYIEFTSEKETIRGKEFNMVKMNGIDAGFTTHLGAKWEPWMAFRELYCNAKDENGETGIEKKEMDTVVTVECLDIYAAWQNRFLYFLEGNPIYKTKTVEIHKGPARPFIYFRGIAVLELETESKYVYNLLSGVELTEDRTAKSPYSMRNYITKCIQQCRDVDVLHECLASREYYEFTFNYETYHDTSEEFLNVVSEIMQGSKGVNDSAREVYLEKRRRKGEFPTRTLSPVEEKMLERAKAFLVKIKINVDDFEVVNVTGLGENVMGRALKNKIYLSDIPFQKGTKQVASTLLEEWVHLKNEVGDFDRGMQDWLFDKVLSMGESMLGEPL